jgi:hypothetical protein
MMGFDVVPDRRLFLHGTLLFGAAALALLGCSDSGPAAQDAAIGIETSQMSVVIENKVGMPLTDVDVAIVPLGAATEFTKFLGRMENAEKRDVALGSFLGRDGTTFSLRVVRPKAVRVTGKDLNAKAYSVERAWK